MNLVFNSTGPLLDHLDLEHINWISLSFDSFQTAGLARPYWRTFPCYRYGSFSFSLVRAFPTDGITSTRVESTKPKKKINKSRLVVGRDLWSFCLFLFFIGPAHRQKRLRRRHQQFQTAAAARPIAITITRWWKSGGGLLQQAFLRQLIKYKKKRVKKCKGTWKECLLVTVASFGRSEEPTKRPSSKIAYRWWQVPRADRQWTWWGFFSLGPSNPLWLLFSLSLSNKKTRFIPYSFIVERP